MRKTTRSIRSGLVAVAGALALALAACGPADTTKWQTVAPDGAGFAVSMPGSPREDRHVASGAKTAFDSTVYTLVLPDGGFFSVTESRFPLATDTTGGADDLLEQACDDVVESAGAAETSRQKIYLNGSEGRRVEGSVPESVVPGAATLSARAYLVGDRRYVLVAELPRGKDAGAADRFFDSFRLRTP